jgi:hypothetical protein
MKNIEQCCEITSEKFNPSICADLGRWNDVNGGGVRDEKSGKI